MISSDKKSTLLGFNYKRVKTQPTKSIIKVGLYRGGSCRFSKVISGSNDLTGESTTIFSN